VIENLSLERWASFLRGLADAGLAGRPVGAPEAFARWSGGERSAPAPADCSRDDALWWGVLDSAIEPLDYLDTEPDGPLFSQESSRTIEVWTERELSGLHALDRLAALRGRSDLAARARASARWHINSTQPDNATNRPWAVHLFLKLATESDLADARLYAETLVHNCQTAGGAPDALSGLILRDAAEALEAEV